MPIEVDMPDGTKKLVSRLFTPPTQKYKPSLKSLTLYPNQTRYYQRIGIGGNMKQGKAQDIIPSVGLSLAPNKESGYNVCPNTTPGCTRACVFHGGMTQVMPQIKPSQIAKTRSLFQQPEEFVHMMMKELKGFVRKYDRLVCRLNVYSDLPWERLAPIIFTSYPQIMFYDYTKVPRRIHEFLDGKFPKNYHLTFSRSEVNEEECRRVLAKGGNVTVVFPKESIPKEFWGYEVIKGDDNDLRYLDPAPRIISLYAKNAFGRRDQTGFVVRLPMAPAEVLPVEPTTLSVEQLMKELQ